MFNLRDREWGEFKIGDLFNVKIGQAIDGNKVNLIEGKTAYITRKESNNGLDGFIDYRSTFLNAESPVITIGNETAEPFVQTFPFFTGTKVNILSAKKAVSSQALLFVVQSMKMHKSKYSYSFTINSARAKKQTILLPIADDGKPDWQFMEDYICEREQGFVQQYVEYAENLLRECNVDEVVPLRKKAWSEFVLRDIFTTIQRGKRLKTADHKKGHTPYVSSTAFNNGVDAFISNQDGVRRFNNCLTIANSGSVGKTFYHPYELVASDHVTQLKNSEFNQYVYLFLTSIISRLEEKYSFNREMNDLRIKRDKLLLPVDDSGNPDWAYMEQYAKSIMRKQLQAYLAHIVYSQ